MGPFGLGFFYGVGRALGQMLFTRGFWIFALCCAVGLGCCGSFVACAVYEEQKRYPPEQSGQLATQRWGEPRTDVPEAMIGDWRSTVAQFDPGSSFRLTIGAGTLGEEVG